MAPLLLLLVLLFVCSVSLLSVHFLHDPVRCFSSSLFTLSLSLLAWVNLEYPEAAQKFHFTHLPAPQNLISLGQTKCNGTSRTLPCAVVWGVLTQLLVCTPAPESTDLSCDKHSGPSSSLHGHTARMSKRPYTSHVQIYRDFFAIGHGCTAHSSPIRIHCKNCSLGSQTNWPAVSPILQYWLSSRLRWARSKHCCWRTVSLEWTLMLLLTKSILTVLMTLSPSPMELSELLPRVLLRMSRRVVSLWGL